MCIYRSVFNGEARAAGWERCRITRVFFPRGRRGCVSEVIARGGKKKMGEIWARALNYF